MNNSDAILSLESANAHYSEHRDAEFLYEWGYVVCEDCEDIFEEHAWQDDAEPTTTCYDCWVG